MVLTLTSEKFSTQKGAGQIELSEGDGDEISPTFYLTITDKDIDIEMGFNLMETKTLIAFLQNIIER